MVWETIGPDMSMMEVFRYAESLRLKGHRPYVSGMYVVSKW